MAPPSPPFDRAIALACTLPALRARWVHLRCGCGASHGLPIRLVLAENRAAARWTLADLVVRVRCKQCRGKALTLHLAEESTPGGYRGYGGTLTWALLLHEAAGGATEPG